MLRLKGVARNFRLRVQTYIFTQTRNHSIQRVYPTSQVSYGFVKISVPRPVQVGDFGPLDAAVPLLRRVPVSALISLLSQYCCSVGGLSNSAYTRIGPIDLQTVC